MHSPSFHYLCTLPRRQGFLQEATLCILYREMCREAENKGAKICWELRGWEGQGSSLSWEATEEACAGVSFGVDCWDVPVRVATHHYRLHASNRQRGAILIPLHTSFLSWIKFCNVFIIWEFHTHFLVFPDPPPPYDRLPPKKKKEEEERMKQTNKRSNLCCLYTHRSMSDTVASP